MSWILGRKCPCFLLPCDDTSIREMGRKEPESRRRDLSPSLFYRVQRALPIPFHLDVGKQSRFLLLGRPRAHKQPVTEPGLESRASPRVLSLSILSKIQKIKEVL